MKPIVKIKPGTNNHPLKIEVGEENNSLTNGKLTVTVSGGGMNPIVIPVTNLGFPVQTVSVDIPLSNVVCTVTTTLTLDSGETVPYKAVVNL